MAIKDVILHGFSIFGNRNKKSGVSGGNNQRGKSVTEGGQTGGPSMGAPRRGRKRINPAATAVTKRGVAHQKRLTGLAFAQDERSGD